MFKLGLTQIIIPKKIYILDLIRKYLLKTNKILLISCKPLSYNYFRLIIENDNYKNYFSNIHFIEIQSAKQLMYRLLSLELKEFDVLVFDSLPFIFSESDDFTFEEVSRFFCCLRMISIKKNKISIVIDMVKGWKLEEFNRIMAVRNFNFYNQNYAINNTLTGNIDNTNNNNNNIITTTANTNEYSSDVIKYNIFIKKGKIENEENIYYENLLI